MIEIRYEPFQIKELFTRWNTSANIIIISTNIATADPRKIILSKMPMSNNMDIKLTDNDHNLDFWKVPVPSDSLRANSRSYSQYCKGKSSTKSLQVVSLINVDTYTYWSNHRKILPMIEADFW